MSSKRVRRKRKKYPERAAKIDAPPVPSRSFTRYIGPLAWVTPLALPWGYAEIVSGHLARVTFRWFLISVPLVLGVHFAWRWLEQRNYRLTGPVLVAVTGIGFGIPASVTIRDALRATFIFVAPGAFVNGDSWTFWVNHRGPETVYDANVM